MIDNSFKDWWNIRRDTIFELVDNSNKDKVKRLFRSAYNQGKTDRDIEISLESDCLLEFFGGKN